jgi:myo-inositol-1(or 4)-monophosphatase
VTHLDDLGVARLAVRAGAEVVRGALGLADAEFKGEVNPVTATDRAAEASILSVLDSYRPEDEVLSEEAGGKVTVGRRWLVDPLDGTVNFLHHIPQVAVSVALYDEDQPLVGVVADVFHDDMYWAVAGKGAWSTSGELEVAEAPLAESLVGTGFPYDRRSHAAEYLRALEAVLEAGRDVRRMGSAALDLAAVAAGRFGGFWEYGLGPWDVAAGILLVREAGGVVTDHRGAPAKPGDPTIVAASPAVHPDLIGLVASHLPEHLR